MLDLVLEIEYWFVLGAKPPLDKKILVSAIEGHLGQFKKEMY
ncbi:hypothetical protein SAMN04487911_11952 [Arenibacter nanhaiticus]|uniref:Uncharacterized protein n=1 Tax=Arenibacter nanhaiticus TaxID=558155 RepID=A0A1M6IX27_9FLAO|nr:hypothetical protein SAMN04487911_11952 [Arenibacter nanhaiticus]